MSEKPTNPYLDQMKYNSGRAILQKSVATFPNGVYSQNLHEFLIDLFNKSGSQK